MTPLHDPTPPDEPTLRLRALGGLSLESNRRTVDGPAAQSRRLALLALLAVHDEGGLSRDRIVALLWPEADAERARHRLGQLLHLLRQDGMTADAVQGTAQLRLDRAAIASDVGAFLEAAARGDWDAAVAQYGGPFLEGFHLGDSAEFDSWLDATRESLRRRYRAALERLGRAEEHGHAVAVGHWLRLAADDPLDGRVALETMKALDHAGDPSGALGHGESHRAHLDRELGVAPSPQILALVDALRARMPVQSPVPIRSRDEPVLGARTEAGPPPPSRRHWALAAALVLVTALATVLLRRSATWLDPRLVLIAGIDSPSGDLALRRLGGMATDYVAHGLAGWDVFWRACDSCSAAGLAHLRRAA